MKKLTLFIAATTLISCSLSFAGTLHSLTAKQLKRHFINKTFVSVPIDNLNGKTIHNTFSMYLDGKGTIFGTMSLKPKNEPRKDQGKYSISKKGVLFITWDNWDGKKKLAAEIYNTKNAYLAIGRNHVFHTIFMKSSVKNGNQLK